MVLEKTLERHLDCQEIKPVNPKGNQSWIFIGRNDAETETPILWPPDSKNWFIGKDPDAGKDWRQEEKGTTDDKMVGWHHQHDGHEFEQALGVDGGQGNLACCSPWGHNESHMTEWLNWTDISHEIHIYRSNGYLPSQKDISGLLSQNQKNWFFTLQIFSTLCISIDTTPDAQRN